MPPRQGRSINLAIGIVAHRSRQRQADRLCDLLEPETCSVDDGTLGADGNHLKVLRTLASHDADWVMVLEDDAVPCHDFLFHVEQALEHAPAPIIGLYLGTGNPSGEVQRKILQAVMARRAWITADCLIGAVGYILRASLLTPSLLADLERRDGELCLRLSRYAQDWDLRVAYTQPSLVDHADERPCGGEVPRDERKAWFFGPGRERWDTPVVWLGFCPDWSKA